MKKVYQFNKVVYKGNIDRDFYLFCCSKNKKLYLYIFKHVLFFIFSLISNKAEYYYKTTYHSYLKKIKNINHLIVEFSKKNKQKINKWYLDNYNSKNIVISNSPEIIVKPFLKEEKLIAVPITKKCKLDFEKYDNEVNKIVEKFDVYYCNTYRDINLVVAKYKFIKKGSIFISYENTKAKKMFYFLYRCFFPIVLSLLLLLLTFQFTTIYIDKVMINNYLHEPKLMLLNLLPIVIVIYILLLLTKRLWIAFSLTSFMIFIIGIVNKTKLFYRDDVLKFEDILLLKEAIIMTNRYKIIVRWYTILSIIICLLITLLLRKNYSKVKMKKKFVITSLIITITFGILLYKEKYTNEDIYLSVGNTSNINTWIATRQSQIRGLIYPFIYSSSEIFNNIPKDYDATATKKTLEKYNYENIPEDKKINIIAIMLEAYNDFSKFDSIEFTDDVYEKFHKIQKDSLSGNIVVDIFGGGTIRTERQFLTGFYNFPTFRKETNSYVRYFKEQGYMVNAYHPIFGAFYNRNTENYNLGFDKYWNYENRFNTYTGWGGYASDFELYSELIKDFENNMGKDKFYFAVTYQNHGPYSTQAPNETYMKNNNFSESGYNMLNNYLAGIKDTNDALYNLVEYIDSTDEPTILIFFGDHNPYLGEKAYAYIEAGIDMDTSTINGFENYYTVPYVIHANKKAKKIFNKDFKGKLETISPNFLMNELFEYMGLKGNEYLQYTSKVKKEINVIGDIYIKEKNTYIYVKNSQKKEIINEFFNVNYYWANNIKK